MESASKHVAALVQESKNPGMGAGELGGKWCLVFVVSFLMESLLYK